MNARGSRLYRFITRDKNGNADIGKLSATWQLRLQIVMRLGGLLILDNWYISILNINV